ncbi:MAG: chemotaxis protein CheC [Burkholderiales bacterium]|nr:chemotaxis protein CheC [Burkholderiales bacterium]
MTELLSSLQQDALCEIINIGVGRAAMMMSEFTGTEIALSVPSIHLHPQSQIGRSSVGRWPRVGAVTQYFDGVLKGEALFLFPDNDGEELARIMAGNLLAVSGGELLARDALQEMGSILLNGCLSTFADLLGGEIQPSLPVFQSGSTRDVLSPADDSAHAAAIFVHIEFMVESERIEGSFCFLIKVPSAERLAEAVDQFIVSPPASA